jgi:hypothetical protein
MKFLKPQNCSEHLQIAMNAARPRRGAPAADQRHFFKLLAPPWLEEPDGSERFIRTSMRRRTSQGSSQSSRASFSQNEAPRRGPEAASNRSEINPVFLSEFVSRFFFIFNRDQVPAGNFPIDPLPPGRKLSIGIRLIVRIAVLSTVKRIPG